MTGFSRIAAGQWGAKFRTGRINVRLVGVSCSPIFPCLRHIHIYIYIIYIYTHNQQLFGDLCLLDFGCCCPQWVYLGFCVRWLFRHLRLYCLFQSSKPGQAGQVGQVASPNPLLPPYMARVRATPYQVFLIHSEADLWLQPGLHHGSLPPHARPSHKSASIRTPF